jgi:hypothetical protein
MRPLRRTLERWFGIESNVKYEHKYVGSALFESRSFGYHLVLAHSLGLELDLGGRDIHSCTVFILLPSGREFEMCIVIH